MTKPRFLLLALCSAALVLPSAAQPVSIQVDAAKTMGPLRPVWAFFGYDEPNYTYMKDGKKLLSELAALSPVPVYVRVHSLLVTGDGQAALKWGSTNAYTEDASGKPVYDWTIVDRIFDTYMERKMKPLVQIGFMPQALSSQPEPYRHHWKPGDNYNDIYTGWAYPPKDYTKWAELVLPMGDATACRSTAGPKWNPGCGKCGTSRTSATGRARRRSTTSSTTTRRTR